MSRLDVLCHNFHVGFNHQSDLNPRLSPVTLHKPTSNASVAKTCMVTIEIKAFYLSQIGQRPWILFLQDSTVCNVIHSHLDQDAAA